jgi:hypothetical protein
MLFEIPKELLHNALKRIGPAIQANSDPLGKAQYLIMKGKDAALSAWIVRQDLTALVEINSSDISIGTEFKSTVQGKALFGMIAKTNISGMVKAEFEATPIDAAAPAEKAEEEGEAEEGAPAQEPVPVIGNMLLLLPSKRKQPEKLRIPAVQWAADPEINSKGTTRLTVMAEELSALVSNIEIAYDKAAPSQYKNCLIRTKGDGYILTLMAPGALARATGTLIKASDEFDICVGYEAFKEVVKMLVPEQAVEIIVNEGTPGTMVLSQDIIYGDNTVGKCYLRISCAKDKFTPFEKKLAALSPRFTAKIKRQHLEETAAKFEVVGGIKVRFTPDADGFKLKKQGQDGSIEELALDAAVSNGDPFEFESYSKYWKSVSDKAMTEDVEITFSGKNDLLKATLGDGFLFYFMAIGVAN